MNSLYPPPEIALGLYKGNPNLDYIKGDIFILGGMFVELITGVTFS